MNQVLHDTLHKEITRKEFIGTIALAVASLFGFSTIISLFFSKKSTKSTVASSRDYGHKRPKA